jgi:hypothetical protein
MKSHTLQPNNVALRQIFRSQKANKSDNDRTPQIPLRDFSVLAVFFRGLSIFRLFGQMNIRQKKTRP